MRSLMLSVIVAVLLALATPALAAQFPPITPTASQR